MAHTACPPSTTTVCQTPGGFKGEDEDMSSITHLEITTFYTRFEDCHFDTCIVNMTTTVWHASQLEQMMIEWKQSSLGICAGKLLIEQVQIHGLRWDRGRVVSGSLSFLQRF